MEIWNLVFIQYNATGDPDNPLSGLPAKHVDTGMGFERVCAVIQCTDGLKDFSRRISNYETDVFSPIFAKLEELSGRKYGTDETADIAFRAVADHIRCLSFAIADGIAPSNEGRGYVLRRILRRAIRYGRNLGFREPFFYKLTDVVAANFGDVFPELRRNKSRIEQTLHGEEESFNRTLDRGIEIFEEAVASLGGSRFRATEPGGLAKARPSDVFPAAEAFKLYDTYGFPLDLTELMARERGLTVDVAGFEKLMEEQRRRAREDYEKKKATVAVVGEGLKVAPTQFLGYENLESESVVDAVVAGDKPGELEVVLDRTPFYAEAGGQVGDTGLIHVPGHDWTELGRLTVQDTQRENAVHIHRAKLLEGRAPEVGEAVRVAVDATRRANVQRHHTVTHLFHWALHEVVSRDARQRGSLVAPDHLRFDFNHPERLTETQIADVERLVNERIRENAVVHWFEVPYDDIKGNPNVMQFFGEKYGDVVRVVQVGGHAGKLDGYSMELCGGTHTKTTGEIGLFKISRESAIAAGVRRVEALCGHFATEYIEKAKEREVAEAERARERERKKDEERRAKSEAAGRAVEIAEELLGRARSPLFAEASAKAESPPLVAEIPDATPELLRAVVDALKPKLKSVVVVLGAVSEGKANLICYVTPDLVKAGKHAGKIVGELAKLCGGGGGGRPDLAQAGGKQPDKLMEALRAVPALLAKA